MAVKPSAQPVRREPTLYELVIQYMDDYAHGRLVRCNRCKDFFRPSTASVAACTVCIYTVGRCENCGGEAGAMRSVIAHCRSMSVKLSVRLHGLAHFNAKAKVLKDNEARQQRFKLLAGGKR